MVGMASEPLQGASGIILIERIFSAPRALVFANWIDADEAAEWFAPDGFTAVHSEMDAAPGGRWRIDFQAPDGQLHTECGVFLEIIPPERLVFTLTQSSGGQTGPETTVAVVFSDVDGGTRMRFKQSGYTAIDVRDGNAEGWQECFGKLARRLEAAQSSD